MVTTYQADNMNDLLTAMSLDLVTASADDLDIISNVDVAKHDVVATAESMAYNFDLKTIWVGRARWNMMVRQYLDPDLVQGWLRQSVEQIGRKGRGQAVLRTRVVKPRGGAATGHTNKETRRWGSCMLSVSYRAMPKPTITLHSRTSYLGYLAALDFNIAHVLAKYLADAMGLTVEDFRFVWMVEVIQWHGFKSLPWLICNDDDEIKAKYRHLLLKKLTTLEGEEHDEATTPAMQICRRWLNFVRREDQDGKSYGETNYNTYRRIRRRWHTEVFGLAKAKTFEGWSVYRSGEQAGENKEYFKAYAPLPHCWTGGLDLSGIRLPMDGSWRKNLQLAEMIEVDDQVCIECGEIEEE